MDKSKEILKYILNNQGTTEYMVAKYMAKNNICARQTTNNIIYNSLIPSEKVIDRKKGNSFHRLYINNENEFIKLQDEIDRLFGSIDRINSFIHADLFKKNRLYRGLVELSQRVISNRIGQLAWKISVDIESSDERELLYSNLVNVLQVSSGLNEKTSHHFYEELDEIGKNCPIRDKETSAMVKGIIEYTMPFASDLT
jgi:hypothetical protein